MLISDVQHQAEGINIFREVKKLKCLQGETVAELGAFLPIILDKAFKGEL
jgi:hypothetical protein